MTVLQATDTRPARLGQVVTFYSYKGGVGRTMALANIGVSLSRWGYRVLMVDWDLEAPGLEFFFKDHVPIARVAEHEGVIDLLSEVIDHASVSNALDWRKFLVNIPVAGSLGTLDLLTAGKRDGGYFQKVRKFDLSSFYRDRHGGEVLERLRDEWKRTYDLVLIDSRTGITDIGGVCTVQLPDYLVLVFTATEQGFEGVVRVARKAAEERLRLPGTRLALLTIPLPSRFDTKEEFQLSQHWLDKFAAGLGDFYASWLPRHVPVRSFLERTKIPYATYFSFGERLPVLEHGTMDPAGLGFAYENIAALLAHNFERVDMLVERRDEYVALASARKASAQQEAAALPVAAALDLQQVLALHQEWLTSGERSGKRADLSSADLAEKDLAGKDLRRAVLAGANLVNTDLRKTNFAEANLSSAVLIGANLDDANCERAQLQGARMGGVSARRANFDGANLQGCLLNNTDLREARLTQAALHEVDFTGAKLAGADFGKASAGTAKLQAAQLAHTRLRDAVLPSEINQFDALTDARSTAGEMIVALGAGLVLAVLMWITAGASDLAVLLDRFTAMPQDSKISIRIVNFMLPFLALGCYAYLMTRMPEYAAAINRLPAIFPDGEKLRRKSSGLLLSSTPRAMRDTPRMSGESVLIDVYAWAIVWWLIPVSLLVLWARYMRAQSTGISMTQLGLMVTAVLFGALTYYRIRVAEAAASGAAASRRIRMSWKGWLGVSVMVVSLSFAIYRQFFASLGSSLDVSGKDISQRPAGWVSGDTTGVIGPSLARRSLIGLEASNAFLMKARLDNVRLGSANLLGANLASSVLEHAYLDLAILQRANLVLADFDSAYMFFVHGDSADFRAASMRNVFATWVRFRGATLDSTDLTGTRLTSADLSGASLAGAILRGALLDSADVNGASFREADLRGADFARIKNFRSVRDLGLANLNEVKGLSAQDLAWAVDTMGAVRVASDEEWLKLKRPVSTVFMQPEDLRMQVGQRETLRATPQDALGNAIEGLTAVWTSTNSAVATVSSAGLVTGVSPGTSTVQATYGRIVGRATVIVTSGSVAVQPPPDSTRAASDFGQLALATSSRLVVGFLQNDSAIGSGLVVGFGKGTAFVAFPASLATAAVKGNPTALTVTSSLWGDAYELNILDASDALLNVRTLTVQSDVPLTPIMEAGRLPVGMPQTLMAREPVLLMVGSGVRTRRVTGFTVVAARARSNQFIEIETQRQSVRSNDYLLGAAVFNRRNELIGMVTRVRGSARLQAVQIQRVIDFFNKNSYPVLFR